MEMNEKPGTISRPMRDNKADEGTGVYLGKSGHALLYFSAKQSFLKERR